MRKVLFLIVIVSVICLPLLVLSQPKDVKGWGKTKWGMTDEEIRAALGNQVEPYPDNYEYYKVHIDLWIPSIDIGKNPYEVRFEMDNGTDKLILVWITPNRNVVPRYAYEYLFESLEEQLIQKYGASNVQKNQEDNFTIRERKWSFPSTSIKLYYSKGPGIGPMLNLFYSQNKEENL